MADFTALAADLRSAILDFYSRRGEAVTGLETTIATNSELVERRAAPLISMLSAPGVPSIDGLRLLDLGCGFGALSVYFAANGAKVTGIDPNEARLEVGRTVSAAHDLPVELKQGRMESLDLSEASFDLAVMNNSLCYIVDRDQRDAALRGTRDALRPGGSLVIRNPNRWNPIDQFTGLPLIHLLPPAAAVRAASRAGRKRSRCRLTSPREALRELREAGFVDVRQPRFASSNAKPDALKVFARYQHFTAHRPQQQSA